VYNDNLSNNIISSFSSVASANNIVTYNSKTLGLPQNVSDPDFFDALSLSIESESATGAIVLTTDIGSKDKGIKIAISQHRNDNICTIQFSKSLQNGKELNAIAYNTLLARKGFKVLMDICKKYKEILLSKSMCNLIIRSTDRNDKIKNETIRNVFK